MSLDLFGWPLKVTPARGEGVGVNKLFYGDNLEVLAELFQGKKPDIPFVDPASVKRAKREDETAGKQGNLL